MANPNSTPSRSDHTEERSAVRRFGSSAGPGGSPSLNCRTVERPNSRTFWERMAEHSYPDVHLVRGENPSLMTGAGTNTYVLAGPEPLLIDAGAGDAEHEERLLACLGANRLGPLARVVITHFHPDHVGGLDQVRHQFPEAVVYR